jgi:hypothetical protein
MVWNSITRSSRLALPRLHIPVDYGAFRCSTFVRVTWSLKDIYSRNNYTLFMTFGITVNTFVHMWGIKMFLSTHAMSIRFWLQNWYDRSGTRVMF